MRAECCVCKASAGMAFHALDIRVAFRGHQQGKRGSWVDVQITHTVSSSSLSSTCTSAKVSSTSRLHLNSLKSDNAASRISKRVPGQYLLKTPPEAISRRRNWSENRGPELDDSGLVYKASICGGPGSSRCLSRSGPPAEANRRDVSASALGSLSSRPTYRR